MPSSHAHSDPRKRFPSGKMEDITAPPIRGALSEMHRMTHQGVVQGVRARCIGGQRRVALCRTVVLYGVIRPGLAGTNTGLSAATVVPTALALESGSTQACQPLGAIMEQRGCLAAPMDKDMPNGQGSDSAPIQFSVLSPL